MSRTKQRARKATGKRKRSEDDEAAPAAKKQEINRPDQTTYDEAVSNMDPSLLSDHFAKALQKHLNKSTTLELEDKHLPTRSFRDTTSFSKPHVAKEFPDFLETFSEGGKEKLCVGETAAPHTLIITSSGIRAADLTREVRVFAKDDTKVAKLFAKHMKIKQSIEFLTKTKINIGIGTPQRPSDLIDQGALKLDKLKRIVIDGSYVDEKKRTIFDVAEIFLAMVELLNTKQIKPRLSEEKDGIEILVF